jgi:WD40 repeat protein
MLGTDVGFQVHQSYPLALKFSRVLNGGIGLVQILNKSNIFCLVGGGESPKYAPNKLLIWDDKKGKEVYEFRFSSFVSNCFIKIKYIFVFCKDSINIISMKTMKIIKEIAIKNNPEGIGSISSDLDKYILSWPSFGQGEIEIKDFQEIKLNSQNIKLKAHSSEINYIKVNNDGTKLASSSINGTTIRIFNLINKQIIQEFKRGNGSAKIYSLNFSNDNNIFVLTSNHGTAHIFLINLKNSKNSLNKNQQKSELSNLNIMDKKILIKKEIEINNENDDNNEDAFEIINNELTSSEIINENQKSIFNGVSQIMGLNNIFQKGYSYTSFKIPTKKESFISFINGSNNKIIVVDKLGNYTLAEIKKNKEVKITKRELLI